jgi:hypothetical protein
MSDQDPVARERPLVFTPQGFLVAILEDADQAEQAKAALAEAGFADRDLRVYTSSQILDSWERFQAERSLAQRVLADHQVLHFRHYGHGSQDDLHIR